MVVMEIFRNRTNDIVIQVKQEDEFIIRPAIPQQPAPTSGELEDDETEALKAISSMDRLALASPPFLLFNKYLLFRSNDSTGRFDPKNVNRRPNFQPPVPPAAGGFRIPHGYMCHRCGQTGHYIKYCPTNGDPTFDPTNRLLNVPQASRKKLANLEGVDVTNTTVVLVCNVRSSQKALLLSVLSI